MTSLPVTLIEYNFLSSLEIYASETYMVEGIFGGYKALGILEMSVLGMGGKNRVLGASALSMRVVAALDGVTRC